MAFGVGGQDADLVEPSDVELEQATSRVMSFAKCQTSTQALHVFHEYPTQENAHSFVLVDEFIDTYATIGARSLGSSIR